jgi:hypothetical protein
MERFAFRFDRLHRALSFPFGVTPLTSYVEVDRERDRFVARFGPWIVTTPLGNVGAVHRTGGYAALKTIGPARLSVADRGLTFATNDSDGACIAFREPVTGIDPAGALHHSALTVTVDDVPGLIDALASSRLADSSSADA